MSNYKTEQEEFWSGHFGDNYIERNRSQALLASNISLFSQILRQTSDVASCCEFGANIGLNLMALRRLLPAAELNGVEINSKAISTLREWMRDDDIPGQAYQASIHDFSLQNPVDLVFTKTVLIHIAPEKLQDVYENLYRSTKKYLLIAEYYNPTPITVSYRRHENRLFKRDFAGELLDRYQTLKLVDYGFRYHRDAVFPQDDITWFLMQRG